MIGFVTTITGDLPAVTTEDVGRLRAAGWDDKALCCAITTCALARHAYIREEGH